MNDLDLARKIADGDLDEAERFVRVHYAAVFRFLRHLVRSREDAEDLTQQVFIIARAKIGEFRGRASLKTWLHRIAYLEYAHWKRTNKRTVSLSHEHTVQEPGYSSFVDGESLLCSLQSLSGKHREAFILHEVEELSVNEIAQILKIPSGTVKARLFYARKHLRALLEDRPEEVCHVPKEAIL